jgi:hypothetical protein
MQDEDDVISEQQRFVMMLRASIAKQLSQPSLLNDVYSKSKLLVNPTATAAVSGSDRSRHSVNSKGHIVTNRYSQKHESRAKQQNIGFVDHMQSPADYQLLIPLSALVADWQGFLAMCKKYGATDLVELSVDTYDVPDLQFLFELVSHLQHEWTSLPQHVGNQEDDDHDADLDINALTRQSQGKRREYRVISWRVQQEESDDTENTPSTSNEWIEKLSGMNGMTMKLVTAESLCLLGNPQELQTLCVGVASDLYSYDDVKQRQYVLAGRAVLFDQETQSDTMQIERYHLRGRLREGHRAVNQSFMLEGQYIISQQTAAVDEDLSNGNVNVNEWRYNCQMILEPLD